MASKLNSVKWTYAVNILGEDIPRQEGDGHACAGSLLKDIREVQFHFHNRYVCRTSPSGEAGSMVSDLIQERVSTSFLPLGLLVGSAHHSFKPVQIWNNLLFRFCE